VTDIIAEIAAASREQSTGIEQVNQAVTQMDQVVQANAAQTEEMSSTAQALAEQAGRLQELVGRFKVAGYGVGVARPTLSAPPPPIVRRVAVKRAGAKPVPVEAVGAHAANGHADGFEEF
jgi:methyl-accepting chemotaxis protein